MAWGTTLSKPLKLYTSEEILLEHFALNTEVTAGKIVKP